MRKVILEKEKEIHFSELKNNSIVGIKWIDGKKSFVFEERCGNFVALNETKVSGACFSEPTLVDYMKRIKKQAPEVFVFDSVKELFKWLSE